MPKESSPLQITKSPKHPQLLYVIHSSPSSKSQPKRTKSCPCCYAQNHLDCPHSTDISTFLGYTRNEPYPVFRTIREGLFDLTQEQWQQLLNDFESFQKRFIQSTNGKEAYKRKRFQQLLMKFLNDAFVKQRIDFQLSEKDIERMEKKPQQGGKMHLDDKRDIKRSPQQAMMVRPSDPLYHQISDWIENDDDVSDHSEGSSSLIGPQLSDNFQDPMDENDDKEEGEDPNGNEREEEEVNEENYQEENEEFQQDEDALIGDCNSQASENEVEDTLDSPPQLHEENMQEVDDDVIFVKVGMRESSGSTNLQAQQASKCLTFKITLTTANGTQFFHPELNLDSMTCLDTLKKTLLEECGINTAHSWNQYSLEYKRGHERSCLSSDQLVRSMVKYVRSQHEKNNGDYEPEIEMKVRVHPVISFPRLYSQQTFTHEVIKN